MGHKKPLICHDKGGVLFWGKPFSHNNKSQNVQHKCPVYISASSPKGLITRKICNPNDPNEKPSSKCAKQHSGPCITFAPNAEELIERAKKRLALEARRSSTKRKSEERYLQRKRHKKTVEQKVELEAESVYFSMSSDDDLIISSESDEGDKKSVGETEYDTTKQRRDKKVEDSNFVDELLQRADKNRLRHLFFVSLYQYRQCLRLATTEGTINRAKMGERESMNNLRHLNYEFLENLKN